MANTKDIRLGYYCEDDDMNLFGPFTTIKECEEYGYSYIWKLEKIADKDCNINSIAIDFSSNTLTIEGGKNSSIKVLDKEMVNGVNYFEPETWRTVLSISKDVCKNVIVTGTPKIEGECLDEMLYM